MKKYELAQYLGNLLLIMQSKESTGRPIGNTLVEEYNRVYDELKKEIEDETGKREQQNRGDSAGDDQPQRISGLYSPDRESRRPGESRGADVHRSGSGSA